MDDEIIEIVPAILCKEAEEVAKKCAAVPSAPILQVDLMDGKFVENTTVGIEGLGALPREKIIEYHLMVKEPQKWIEKLPGGENSIFQVHAEGINEAQAKEIAALVRRKKSLLCWALNPPTPAGALEKIMQDAQEILVMGVHPGKSGQKYIFEVEGKIRQLREKYPDAIIEVDGGIDANTAPGAIRAGANRLVAASAIFSRKGPDEAYKGLKKLANDIK